MTALTKRQREVMRVIRAFLRYHGYAPTLRELGQRLNIHSTNAVSDHLDAIEAKGHISRARNVARGIRVIRRAS